MISLSITNIVLSLLLMTISHFVFRYIVRPLMLVRYYKKQGLKPNYNLFTGELGQYDDHARRYGDCHYLLKKAINEDPKFIGTTFPLGDRACVFFADAKIIQNLALTESSTLIKYNHFIWPWQEYVLKTHLTFTEGDQHKKLKRILSKSLHFEFLKNNVCTVVDIIHEAFEDMEKTGLKDVDIFDVVSSIAGEVIGRSFFGFDHRTAMFKGRKLISSVFDVEIACAKLSQTFTYQAFGPKFVKLGILPSHRELAIVCKEFREYCMNLVQNRKKELTQDKTRANPKYLIDDLIVTQIENPSDSFSDEEILDQYISFFLAGQQSISHSFTMCLYCLAQTPEFVELIRQELKEKVADIDRVEFEILNKLDYLNAAIKEAFRLYAPLQILFFREAIKDFTVEGINIKKGTLVNFYTGYAAFNEKIFKNYEKYDPMRWIDEGESSKLSAPLLLLPFWAGTRNCIGQHLGMLETRMMLIQFVSKYDFKVKEGFKLNMTQTLSYSPIDWFTMDFKKIA